MNIEFRPAIFVSLTLFSLSPVSASEVPQALQRSMTPEQAAWLSLAKDPSLAALRLQANVSGAQVVAAGLLPNPSLSLSYDQPVAGATTGASPGFAAGLAWDVSDFIRRGPRIDQARAQQSQVALDVAWQEWNAFYQTQNLAWQALAQQHVLDLLKANAQDLRQRDAAVESAVRQSLLPQADAVAAAAAMQKARLRVLTAQENLNQTRLALAQRFGQAQAWREVHIVASLDPPKNLDQIQLDKLLSQLDQRLDIRALKAALQAFDYAIHIANLKAFPVIECGVDVARDTGDLYSAGLSLAMPIPLFDRGQAEQLSTQAQRKQAKQLLRLRRIQAEAALRQGLAQLDLSRQRVESVDAALAQQKKLYDLSRAAYEQGLIKATGFYLIQSDYVDLQIEAIQARLALRQIVLNISLQSAQNPLKRAKP